MLNKPTLLDKVLKSIVCAAISSNEAVKTCKRIESLQRLSAKQQELHARQVFKSAI